MPQITDSFDDVWDLAIFSVREALALRSLLENLQTVPQSVESKLAKIQNWRGEVARLLGTPEVGEHPVELLQAIRGGPPQGRKAVIEKALAAAQALYFGPLT
jgi:hypothetical protein